MNDHQISQLVATLEGAYPQSKISPSKVLATWQASKRLQTFNNARRGDLINHLLQTSRYFPSLPEVIDACAAVEPRDEEPTCEACAGLGHIHHIEGDDIRRAVPVSGAAGKGVQYLEYEGTPILYTFVQPCPICNPKGRR